jgi:hypothetical protein
VPAHELKKNALKKNEQVGKLPALCVPGGREKVAADPGLAGTFPSLGCFSLRRMWR